VLHRDPHSDGRSFTWYELVGIVVAVGAGIIGAILSGNSEKLQVISVLLGLAIAITIGVIAQLDRAERRIVEKLSEIDEVILPMTRDLALLPEIGHELEQIASAAARAKDVRGTFIYSQIVRRVAEDRKVITNICNGDFLCRNRMEEFGLLDAALATASSSVQAIASLGLAHWIRPGWHEYFLRYINHAKDNPSVRHTRIFILTPEEANDPAMKRILSDHRAAKIETLAVDKAKVNEEFRKALVLFDRDLVMLHVDRSATSEQVQVTFTDETSAIRDAAGTFTTLIDLARDEPMNIVP
jgi:hypothetical protein